MFGFFFQEKQQGTSGKEKHILYMCLHIMVHPKAYITTKASAAVCNRSLSAVIG